MKVSKKTVEVLKAFATINTNLVIRPGKKITTITPSKSVYAEATVEDEFKKQLCIYNLNEFLAVLSAFSDPELDIADKHVTITDGNNKVKYIFADEALLTLPPAKQIKLPSTDVSFKLTSLVLAQVLKVAQILAVEDLAFIGNGKKVVARVFDAKNPSGNSLDVDLDFATKQEFNIQFKIENMKLVPADYDVEISKAKLAKFDNNAGIVTFVAVEATSTFED